jgi:hypothetical protein
MRYQNTTAYIAQWIIWTSLVCPSPPDKFIEDPDCAGGVHVVELHSVIMMILLHNLCHADLLCHNDFKLSLLCRLLE